MVDVVEQGYNLSSFINKGFYTILIIMSFDIITGLLKAFAEKNINSSMNREVLIRKLGILIGFMFVTFVDEYFKMDGTIVAIGVITIISFEGLSVIENLSKIGVPLEFLTKYFDNEKVNKKVQDDERKGA